MSEEARKHYEKYGDNDNYDDEMQIEKIEKEYEKYLKKDAIINMAEEILRLKKELKKYKWTKDEPLSKALRHLKMEFFWDEGNEFRLAEPRVFFHPFDGVGIDMPVFKLIEYFDVERRNKNGNDEK